LRNPNPYDGEPFYNLGLARIYQLKRSAAYDAFHKSVWNYAWQSAGFFALAQISAERADLSLALEEVERSLLTNAHHLKALALKAALLRKMGCDGEARALIGETLALDRLDFRMMAERFLLSREPGELRAYLAALDGDVQTLLDVVFDLAWSGLRDDAFLLLEACVREEGWEHPMLLHTLAWLAAALGLESHSNRYAAQAEAASPLYCFPARLEEMIVLEDCIRRHPQGARAHYYLGNLYYDKRRFEEAIRCWRASVELDSSFSIPFRNLGIAEFNILHDPEAANRMYARAFAVNPGDARVLYEWDQLQKRGGLATGEERLRRLEEHKELVERRDDLSVEYITLLNQCGQWQAALERLSSRRFSPWEGGEGLVSAQYVAAHRALGLVALAAGKTSEALDHFEAARHYPENLGEGKHLLTLERDLDYFSGLAAQQAGDAGLAQLFWSAAAAPLPTPSLHSYFQGLALRALGRREAADEVFTRMADFARRQMEAEPKIDYFATSLPNMLLFDDDLARRNRLESLLLGALAKHGMGEREMAEHRLRELLAEDPNHLFAAEMLRWMQSPPGSGLGGEPADR
ncbi:MAG: tetratricopeptide repeat protein, partial [Acidobacteriota bacterium]|nr:tetratricopeptide repeat protein [Acidobacteriota bacterium]